MAEPKLHDWFWYELMTPDQDGAAKFYGDVLGWKISEYPGAYGGPRYLVASAGDRGVAGIMTMPTDVPGHAKPHWVGYISTDDADKTANEIASSGGSVRRGPQDIPTVGRFAVVTDPEGGFFCIMKPFPQQQEPAKIATNTPGNVSWQELHSDNPEQNFAWYEKQFGWKRGEAIDMGPNGTYQMFSSSDEPVTGGSCGKMGGEMPTHWLFYFYVDRLDGAIERVKTAGGQIFMGPHEVPGGTWIAIGNDPQGGIFALHSEKK